MDFREQTLRALSRQQVRWTLKPKCEATEFLVKFSLTHSDDYETWYGCVAKERRKHSGGGNVLQYDVDPR
jgi:hypothetical protein